MKLDQFKTSLSVFFHALGGPGGVELAASGKERSGHRLSFRRRIGADQEKTDRTSFDGAVLRLPSEIACFPEQELNRALYFWLAAYFADAPAPLPDLEERDFLWDCAFLQQAGRTTRMLLQTYPGLAPVWEKLTRFLLQNRPDHNLPDMEKAVEKVVRSYLAARNVTDFQLAEQQLEALKNLPKPRNYKTFLPVPLWGDVIEGKTIARETPPDEDFSEEGDSAQDDSGKKRKAQRRNLDQAQRDDGFALHIYDKLLSVVDMVNLNRNVDDDDLEEAKNAADDLDQLSLAKHDHKPASKLKMDLDLPADSVDATRLEASVTLPEWDYRQQQFLADHCAVTIQTASQTSDDIWEPDEAALGRIRRVRRQFEALRVKREMLNRQPDGPEIDLDEVVRARAEFRANGISSDRLYCESRTTKRDLAVSVLVDVSLSTDSWLDNRRVIDVEKEALEIFAHGLQASGDEFAINTFTSKRRHFIRFERVKSFDDPFNLITRQRISALKPGFYTRIGAAVRLAGKELLERPNSQKLLLILTDGKPNDIDHYEGRYGVEDARKAIQEAKRQGLVVFGVTVDRNAQDYFPYIFGRGCYQIVPKAES